MTVRRSSSSDAEMSHRAAGLQRTMLDTLPKITMSLDHAPGARDLAERVYQAVKSDAFTSSLARDPRAIDELNDLATHITQHNGELDALLPALQNVAARLKIKEPLAPLFEPLPGPIIIEEDDVPSGGKPPKTSG